MSAGVHDITGVLYIHSFYVDAERPNTLQRSKQAKYVRSAASHLNLSLCLCRLPGNNCPIRWLVGGKAEDVIVLGLGHMVSIKQRRVVCAATDGPLVKP
jgi:hypothetical protein